MLFLRLCNTASMAFLAGLVPVQGHGVMNYPSPYNLHHPDAHGKTLQVDPLSVAAGYTFPCHGQYDSELDGVTAVKAGETVPVNFVIGADHHGGSCQFGVSYDMPGSPNFHNKASWKTIWTIIGGCPNVNTGPLTDNIPPLEKGSEGRDQIHNCGNDKDKDCIREFYIPLPKELANGKAVFAWTWFNNRGNREMYMNCAPIEITGGIDDKAWYNGLPEMFVANIEGECWTGPTGNRGRDDPASQGILNIPNPGNLGAVLEPPHFYVFDGAEYNCSKATTLPTFNGIGAPSVPSTASASTVSTSTTLSSAPVQSLTFPSSSESTTSGTAKPTLSNTSGFVTSPKPTSTDKSSVSLTSIDISSTSSIKSTSTETPITKPTTSSITTTSSPATTAPTSSTGCSFGAFSCAGKAEGALVCKDENTFGLCVKGCAQPQPVAAGMKCENDQYVAST